MNFPLSIRRVITGLFFLVISYSTLCGEGDAWLPASPEKLPRWRGFNLLNKFMLDGNRPFEEKDFRIVHELGFNFVRLPMDYRIWILDKDWTKLNENALKEIDQAVAWGEKYHVHVCLNFHRAPGYTVAQPAETKSLWTDEDAQQVCAMHWAAFAKRYKGIPSERLSFDLFNEPGNIDAKVYAKVVARMAEAIRREDPDRLIIADGLMWGNVPCPELIPLHVAQATRGYNPMWLTHYKASWIGGADKYPEPKWPVMHASAFFYGPGKKDLQTPMILEGNFPAGTKLEIQEGTVSAESLFQVTADGEEIFKKKYVCGSESKEGEKIVYKPEYKIYQNEYQQTLSVTLPHSAKRIQIKNIEGDWMTIRGLTMQLSPNVPPYSFMLVPDWGTKQSTYVYDEKNPSDPWSGGAKVDRMWLMQDKIPAWKDLESKGVGVIVGEWGCYNKTPYPVTMRWMEDNLRNFKELGWGWSLWNLYGSFGIIDSERPGAVYEDFEGHKLDRKMLELLQKY